MIHLLQHHLGKYNKGSHICVFIVYRMRYVKREMIDDDDAALRGFGDCETFAHKSEQVDARTDRR